MYTGDLPNVTACAIEWLLADGPRTRERLRELIEHWARQSRRMDEIEWFYEQAVKALDWRLED